MAWLIAAITAYFLFAVVSVIDKFLLKESIPDPKIYSFYIGLLGASVFVLAPFGFIVPDFIQILTSLFAGAFFVLGIYLIYIGLSEGEASRVIPTVGGLLPVFTFSLFYIFSQNNLQITENQAVSFLFLILGSVLISFYKEKKKYSYKILLTSVLAAFSLSVFYALTKIVYAFQPFVSGLIWIKIGSLTASLFFLLSKDVRSALSRVKLENLNYNNSKTAGIFISKNALGGIARILENYSVSLARFGEVAFVNAVSGIQYVFILILAVLFSKKFPQIFKEEIRKEFMAQKIIGILFISAGIFLLALK